MEETSSGCMRNAIGGQIDRDNGNFCDVKKGNVMRSEYSREVSFGYSQISILGFLGLGHILD